MSEIQNPTSSSPFFVQALGYFPHFFSDEEREELIKWSAHAIGLTDGMIAPASGRESLFIEVARGQKPPATRFQRLWLRYLQAVNIQTKLRESERRLTASTELLTAANCQIYQLKSDVNRLEIWGKSAWQKTGPADVESARKIRELEAIVPDIQEKLPLSASGVGENSVIEVTNREQYRKLIKNGLTEIADNQIFKLFNCVDEFGLTPQELEVFNNEHEKRKSRYRSLDSGDHGFVVYATTDGQ